MLNVLLAALPFSHEATYCKDEAIYTHAQTYTHIISVATSLTCGSTVTLPIFNDPQIQFPSLFKIQQDFFRLKEM